jgi:predicted nuclease with TOPRIM domain
MNRRRLGMGLAIAFLGAMATASHAQDAQQLQKMYDESQAQLRAAQDRKNELFVENQKLQKRLSELEEQLSATRGELETLENRAWFLREHYASWQDFVELNPPIRAMWQGFFNGALVTTPTLLTDLLGDGKWPFSSMVVVEAADEHG